MINCSLLLDFEENVIAKIKDEDDQLLTPAAGKWRTGKLCAAQSARKHTVFLVAMMQNGFGPTLIVGDDVRVPKYCLKFTLKCS